MDQPWRFVALATGIALSSWSASAAPALAQTGQAQAQAPAAGDWRPRPRPDATASLARFDGLWIGEAIHYEGGQAVRFEQMERIGPMLDGEIRVMEGKARGADGQALFNALTVFSAAEDGSIRMRSWTPGRVGERTIEPTPDGYVWRTPAGPGQVVYDIAVVDGTWRETGWLETPDGARTKVFEMTLTRRGDTDWPAANPAFETR